jgi:SNF2 family DNA or RNA helicase
MRRLKCDVLADLPDKIIQDVYCTMSERQTQLYQLVTANALKSLKPTGGDAQQRVSPLHVCYCFQNFVLLFLQFKGDNIYS